MYHNKVMPKKTTKSGQGKKISKKAPKNKSKIFRKALNKRISFTPLSLSLLFIAIILPLAIALVVHFVILPNEVKPCSADIRVEECANKHDQKLDESSNDGSVDVDNSEEDVEINNNQESSNKHISDSNYSSSSSDSSVLPGSQSQSSNSQSNSNYSSNQDNPSSQNPEENLKVGSSYMGGTIPRALDVSTCFGPTLCAWHLDGSDYAFIYLTEDYHWKGRFLDIINGRLVTSEKDLWAPSYDGGYYAEKIPKLFTNDMVEMARKYGMRVVGKKLLMKVGGVEYSFSPGYIYWDRPATVLVPKDGLSMPQNTQMDFDLQVTPSFYDPTSFINYYQVFRSNNNEKVSVIKVTKKSDGVLTLTLRSGKYEFGISSAVISFYNQDFVVHVKDH